LSPPFGDRSHDRLVQLVQRFCRPLLHSPMGPDVSAGAKIPIVPVEKSPPLTKA
jgi:hypothetical protein